MMPGSPSHDARAASAAALVWEVAAVSAELESLAPALRGSLAADYRAALRARLDEAAACRIPAWSSP